MTRRTESARIRPSATKPKAKRAQTAALSRQRHSTIAMREGVSAVIDDASAAIHNAQKRIADCPELWQFIERRAMEEVAAKRHFSMRALMEEARKIDWTRTDGDPMRVNNSLQPAFSRLLLRAHPEAAPFIEVRRAACDGML